MNVAICDDNAKDRTMIYTLIEEHFKKNGFIGKLHMFSSGEALVSAFSTLHFDAVFLDIYMDGMNGVNTASKLRKINPGFALVFITTSAEHAIDCFALGTDGYVVKPLKRNSIDIALAKCRDTFLKNGRFIQVISNRMKIAIPLIKIIYIETFGRELLFHTTNQKIRSTATMLLSDLEQTLGASFLRCHRSYLVNLNHVAAIRPDSFLMQDDSVVPLRQRRRAELRDTYANFISDQLFEVSL